MQQQVQQVQHVQQQVQQQVQQVGQVPMYDPQGASYAYSCGGSECYGVPAEGYIQPMPSAQGYAGPTGGAHYAQPGVVWPDGASAQPYAPEYGAAGYAIQPQQVCVTLPPQVLR